MTSVFIMSGNQRVNEHILKKKGLRNILLSFIKKHYRSGKYVFWIDLALLIIQKWSEIGFGKKKNNLFKIGHSRQLTRCMSNRRFSVDAKKKCIRLGCEIFLRAY